LYLPTLEPWESRRYNPVALGRKLVCPRYGLRWSMMERYLCSISAMYRPEGLFGVSDLDGQVTELPRGLVLPVNIHGESSASAAPALMSSTPFFPSIRTSEPILRYPPLAGGDGISHTLTTIQTCCRLLNRGLSVLICGPECSIYEWF